MSRGDGNFDVVSNVAGADGSYSPISWSAQIADFNGDGKADILWSTTSVASTPERRMWIGRGDGNFDVVSNVAGADGSYNPISWSTQIADFNGDGKADILWSTTTGVSGSPERRIWRSVGAPPDLLTTITTGLGAQTRLTYSPLTDTTIYTRDNTAVYPEQDVQAPIYAVTQVSAPDGRGGTNKRSYSYKGAKADLSGRGFLGFASVAATDMQTGVVETTTYRQDHPYVGLPKAKTKVLNGLLLNQESLSYTATSLGGTRYFVAPSQVVVSSKDLSGAVMPTITTTTQYDDYGNPTQVKVSTPDGASRTTTNTYTNDPANWLLGRLTRASISSVVP
jgi:hypothetical protein